MCVCVKGDQKIETTKFFNRNSMVYVNTFGYYLNVNQKRFGKYNLKRIGKRRLEMLRCFFGCLALISRVFHPFAIFAVVTQKKNLSTRMTLSTKHVLHSVTRVRLNFMALILWPKFFSLIQFFCLKKSPSRYKNAACQTPSVQHISMPLYRLHLKILRK